MALVIEWCLIMNRLEVRLAIGFVLFAWLVIAVVAGMVNYAIEGNFSQFLNTSNSLRFGPETVEDLTSYYIGQGAWDGVGTLFDSPQGENAGSRQQGRQGQGAQIFVASNEGEIVYASNEDWIGLNLVDIGASRTANLEYDGEVIGILGEQTPGTIALNQAEEQFLQDTTTGLMIITVASGILALTIAIIFARSLTRPLSTLATEVRQMSAGNTGQMIDVNGSIEIARLVTAFNDFSRRLAEEETLRQQMTSDIAHELRTPVTVMRGHLEAMMDGVYPLDIEHLAIAYDGTLHLTRLVEDMRLLTRAEAKQLSLDKTRINPAELITRSAQRFQPLAEDAGIQLDVDIAPELPDLEIDVSRIQQALDNLITNALRHTDEAGEINLSCHPTNGKSVLIRVQNTGKPIPSENLKRIFDRFWRADDARERDAGGTGLGLAITKLLVELHGGSIRALPSDDGAIFEISLPAV